MALLLYCLLSLVCALAVVAVAAYKIPQEDIPHNWSALNFMSRVFLIWLPLWPVLGMDMANPAYAEFNSIVDITWSEVLRGDRRLKAKIVIFWTVAPLAVCVMLLHWLFSGPHARIVDAIFGPDRQAD